jgi:hypothetical protein
LQTASNRLSVDHSNDTGDRLDLSRLRRPGGCCHRGDTARSLSRRIGLSFFRFGRFLSSLNRDIRLSFWLDWSDLDGLNLFGFRRRRRDHWLFDSRSGDLDRCFNDRFRRCFDDGFYNLCLGCHLDRRLNDGFWCLLDLRLRSRRLFTSTTTTDRDPSRSAP